MPKGKKDVKKSKPSKKKDIGLELNIKNKNYNLVKVKKNYLNTISLTIFVMVILVILIGYIIYYLNDLKSCQCFQDSNENNVANLDYLIIIESLGLAMNIIIIINLVSLYMQINKIKSGGAYSYTTLLSLYVGIILYLIIYGFFVYNVFLLSQNVKSDCECALHPIRYLLYIQAAIILFYLILMVFGIFLI